MGGGVGDVARVTNVISSGVPAGGETDTRKSDRDFSLLGLRECEFENRPDALYRGLGDGEGENGLHLGTPLLEVSGCSFLLGRGMSAYLSPLGGVKLAYFFKIDDFFLYW